MKRLLVCFVIVCTVLSLASIGFAAYDSSEHSYDSMSSALKGNAVAGRIGTPVFNYDFKRLYGSVDNNNEVDIFKFSVHLDEPNNLSVKLKVPEGCDYDLYVYDYAGEEIAKSIKGGEGCNEYITIDDPKYLEYAYKENGADEFYVKVEYYSGDSAEYRLDVKQVNPSK